MGPGPGLRSGICERGVPEVTCCGPNRRRMLAALAAIPIVAAAGPARAQTDSMIATDLEVVTITPTSVILTWTTLAPGPDGKPAPVDAGTQVRLAPADSRGPARVRHDDQ